MGRLFVNQLIRVAALALLSLRKESNQRIAGGTVLVHYRYITFQHCVTALRQLYPQTPGHTCLNKRPHDCFVRPGPARWLERLQADVLLHAPVAVVEVLHLEIVMLNVIVI